MVNGVATAPLLAEESAPSSAGKPDEIPAQTGIETAIGAAAADAAVALNQALLEYWDGGLAPTTKMQGGARIARLYELQQATLGTLASTPRHGCLGGRPYRRYTVKGCPRWWSMGLSTRYSPFWSA